jgi:hypothetical protein
MLVSEIVEHASTLSDEEGFNTDEAVGYFNDAIAKINTFCKANFPFVSTFDLDFEYPGFPEKWQRVLIIPFIVGRIKQKDASQFEYADSYAEFISNLVDFKAEYVIHDSYKDKSVKTRFETTFSNSPWGW